MTAQIRLRNDDFKALRSLARSRWIQGREIHWKFNRTWSSAPLSDAALDAASRLIKMGLVENFVCCPACGEVFQLTQDGHARARQIDRGPVSNTHEKAPRIKAQQPNAGGWFRRLGQFITRHLGVGTN